VQILSRVGVISGALLYIRDEFDQVDKKTWLQVNFFCTIVLIFCFLLLDWNMIWWDPIFGGHINHAKLQKSSR